MKSRFLLFALAASVLAGCGGSGENPTTTNPPPTGNAYAGNYESAMTLDNGKRGAIALTVADDGDATGTLKVSAAAAAPTRDPFSFTVGSSVTINGTVNADGTFELQGTDPTGGTFEITGDLPVDGNGHGSVTVHAGGETYTGTIALGMGTGSGSLTFSAINGAAISSAPFPSNPYVLFSTVNGNSAVTVIPALTDSTRAFGLAISANVQVGQRVALRNDGLGEILATYSEGQGANEKSWRANSGTIVLVARTDSTIEIKYEDVTFGGDNVYSAPGTFKVNGSFRK